eukprot:85146-Prymnesium_polylepis.1
MKSRMTDHRDDFTTLHASIYRDMGSAADVTNVTHPGRSVCVHALRTALRGLPCPLPGWRWLGLLGMRHV